MCCNLLSTERLGVAKNSYALKRVREFQIELEFEVLGFYGKGKTGVHGEKTLGARERTNNKLNPHMVWTPGLEPGHIGGRQVLYAMRHPCPPRPPPQKKHSIDMGRAWSQANWELERSPAPIGIVKPHCPSLPCLYPSAPVLGSPKGVATVIVNSMFPHSYFITKMFVRHARILKHLLFRRIYQAIVSAYKFFDFHFPGTGQVSRKRNLCGNRRAETGLIQHCAGHRTSL